MTEQKKPWEPEVSFRFTCEEKEGHPETGTLTISEYDGGRGVRFGVQASTDDGPTEVIMSWAQIDALCDLFSKYGTRLIRRAEEP